MSLKKSQVFHELAVYELKQLSAGVRGVFRTHSNVDIAFWKNSSWISDVNYFRTKASS